MVSLVLPCCWVLSGPMPSNYHPGHIAATGAVTAGRDGAIELPGDSVEFGESSLRSLAII